MTTNELHSSSLRLLEEENKRLRRAVEELSFLNELAGAIGASNDLREIINIIIRRSLRAVHAEQGLITLVDPNQSNPTKTLVRTAVSSIELQPFRLHENLLGWMQLNKRPLCINSPRCDDRFRGVKWDESICSLVCVPLLVKSELIGILTVCNKKDRGEFTDDDQRLLSIIAAQSAQIIENARLYEEEEVLLRMQEEMRMAHQIQTNLLPKEPPQVPGYDIAGVSIPSQDVGGDYFDFILMDQNRLALCLGDVSGKGLPASLLMASVQATIRGQSSMNASVSACLRWANRLLYENTAKQQFATLFYSILDTEEQRSRYSSAGHNSPLLFQEGVEPRPLETRGLVLGVVRDTTYEEEVVDFPAGTLMLVYSDGITEAMDNDEIEFGEERLMQIALANQGASSSQIVQKIIDAIENHAANAPQKDDITLVVVKRTEGS